MDVYLDAVLHPKCIEDERTFAQEGWHYELENPKVISPPRRTFFSFSVTIQDQHWVPRDPLKLNMLAFKYHLFPFCICSSLVMHPSLKLKNQGGRLIVILDPF